MKNKDNLRTAADADKLGESGQRKHVAQNPAPREADRESLNTPEENEVYVDLEPEELHLGDVPVEEVNEKKKKK